jgi:mannose-1-phosphate guanylyltransferase
MEHVAAAFDAVRARPELVVLLGIAADRAETEYGWIEPADRIPGTLLFRVQRFWEKPNAALAEELLQRRCLWNSFILVAGIPALLASFSEFVPGLMDAFAEVQRCLGGAEEDRAARSAYRGLRPVSFSEAVLAARPANLATLPVRGVRWSDLGDPHRALATLKELDANTAWAERVAGAIA